MSMKDLEKLDNFMVASMVASNIESIEKLRTDIKKLKKYQINTSQLLRKEIKKIATLKTQMQFLKKSIKTPKK